MSGQGILGKVDRQRNINSEFKGHRERIAGECSSNKRVLREKRSFN